ncbi:hypothetical protein AURDEDRAFT_176786 [Auricularia subglabra TFB-10046 SS5]|uniref:Uncharacterized protein n=1 Tax=Auricularia subglabra (strain TFB-10046 / SS5) TaxID=717982 RepID=J0D5S5_AURST|nr:hypothetical protein AURDEDRAFT_176786 [Auricularia subglabra TFB-10046 SS5]
MNIPAAVTKRLNELMLDPLAIQNPNFAAEDLDYHEPPSIGLPGGATRGSWSYDGVVFEFRLVGQISGHQTFLGDYGDLFFTRDRSRKVVTAEFALADVTKAKRKVTLAIPHVSSEDSHHQVLRRQFEHLQDIENENLREFRSETTTKKTSFVVKTDTHWRASTLSDNIFVIYESLQVDLPSAAGFDPKGIVSKLPGDVRDKMQVMPFEFVGPDGQAVDHAAADATFRPGTWVDLACSLTVWSSRRQTNDARFGSPTGIARSYQIRIDGMQKLSGGRLREGPLRTEPAPRLTKRKFSAVE